MLRSSLFSASAFALLCVTASAQSALTPQKVTAPVKNRGVYHLSTGTWSRANTADSFNSDVLYNNNAPTGYFFGSSTVFNTIDHGRLPSTSSSPVAPSVAGNADAYAIDCFQVAYCSNLPGSPVSMINIFFNCYGPCTDIDAPSSSAIGVAGFISTGLPGGTPLSGQGCWILSFDLANTTVTFCMEADCDGTWDNQANIDSFGWFQNFPNGTGGSGTGPLISGNCPNSLTGISSPPQGHGTKFAGTPGASDATGLGTNDFFWIDSPYTPAGGNGGCFFFGGCNIPGVTGPGANPYGGFWLALFGTKKDTEIGTKYCSSLVNASGGAAIISTGGTDSNVDLTLTSTPVPNTTGQFFYGPMMLLGGSNLGDGLRCVGGSTTRLLPFITAGMMAQPANTAIFTVNYTAPYAAGLTGRKYFQHWFRSGIATGTGSNSSDGVAIDF